jgi:hypothetical protein
MPVAARRRWSHPRRKHATFLRSIRPRRGSCRRRRRGDEGEHQAAARLGFLRALYVGTIHTSRATSPLGHLLSIYLPGGGKQFFRDIDTIDRTDVNAVLTLAARHDMTIPTPTPA